jgi:serine/threonine protein kinase
MSLVQGTKLGPYEVIGPLGSGGMGEVYRARDTRLGREVAIKVLPAERLSDPVRRARFEQEARAASALNHPHIVTIHEIESAEGIDFIVMELVAGKTLDALIPSHGMRLGEALRIAIPLADALAAAHGAGIVHRDLKPANVMVTPEGVVKVLDFGLAKLTHAEESSREDATTLDARAKLSHPGTVVGTPAYMSPQQATGGRVDARSDIFSFGTLLYEMVTGRRPFGGGSSAEVLAALLKEQPQPPSEIVADVPKELERIILRCLRKEPARRFQNMLDVKVELEEVKEESDSTPAVPSVRARRNRGLRVAAGLVGALALATGGLLFWRSRQPERPAPQLVPLTSSPGDEMYPTFSPDGDQIAFVWNGEKTDNWDIYVKMIGSVETHRLTTDPGDDDFPAWSTDGRQIAFVHVPAGSKTGTIHLISPLGGSDRKLSDQPVADEQLSWSPDGRWLATGSAYTDFGSDVRGIRLVETATGEARAVTSPGGSTYHMQPAFSHDGRHLAYFSCVRRVSCQVEVVELGTDSLPKGAARRLSRKGINPAGLAWARDGRSVVFTDVCAGRRIWRVGIAGGAPQRVEVAGFMAYRPATAAARDRLAFVRRGSYSRIYRFEPGRPSEPVAPSSSLDWFPDLSRDGRRLAFQSGRGGEGEEIWLAAADGSNPSQLTHGPGLWQGSPRWSPDGRRIAFDSLDEDGQWDVWTIDADGGTPRRLTTHSADDGMPSWSRDGRFVYFSSNRTGADAIWRVLATGGTEEQVTDAGGGKSQEAPDGKTLFVRGTGAGHAPVFAVPLAGGPARTVIDCAPQNGFAVGTLGVYHVGCVDSGDAPLFVWDPATGRDRPLGTLERSYGQLTVSADGKTILFTGQGGEGEDLVLIENFR